MPVCMRLFVVAFLVLPLGCDSVTPGADTVILRPFIDSSTEGSPLLFSIAGSALAAGAVSDLRCGCRIDLSPWLASQGFSSRDIVEATLKEATVSMGTPVSGRLGAFDDVTLRFGGTGGAIVARSTSLPSAREGPLSPVSGVSVASLIAAGAFEPILQARPGSIDPAATYQFYLTLSLQVEVEGI